MHLRLLGGLFLGSLLIAVTPGVAHAHAEVERISPRSGTVLASPPKAITITFSEPVEVDAVSLLGTDGSVIPSATRITGSVLTITPRGALASSGTLTVTWQVTSDDGHEISGAAAWVVGRSGDPGPSQVLSAQPSLPMTLSGSRPGRLTLSVTGRARGGEIAWSSDAVPGGIVWPIRTAGGKTTAVGVLPLAGPWTAKATIFRADGSLLILKATAMMTP